MSMGFYKKGYHWLMNHQMPQDIVRFVLRTQLKVGTDIKSKVKKYLRTEKQELMKVLLIGNF